jgi:NTE family protein
MTLSDWLREAPFALTMSSGFFGFFAHTGLLTVLEDEGLLPTRISGSSAGALVGGAWASGLSARELADTLLALRRDSFWDPAVGPGLLRGALFRSRLDALLPVTTFAACRVPFAASAFDVVSRRVRVLGRGALAPAIQASCAVPFLFHPVWIDGRPYIDGGVADRPGLAGMPRGERVLFHHLASRSPWRRRGSPAMEIPARANMTAVVIDGLPRVGPFRLEQGARAFDAARSGTRRALFEKARGAETRLVVRLGES